jgi:hypothetical protein
MWVIDADGKSGAYLWAFVQPLALDVPRNV